MGERCRQNFLARRKRLGRTLRTLRKATQRPQSQVTLQAWPPRLRQDLRGLRDPEGLNRSVPLLSRIHDLPNFLLHFYFEFFEPRFVFPDQLPSRSRNWIVSSPLLLLRLCNRRIHGSQRLGPLARCGSFARDG